VRRRALPFWLGLALLAAAPASAHRAKTDAAAPAEGLPISSLTHGQMKVIAENLTAIRALADAQFPTDPVMRRLQGYVSLQSFACLWGWVPGSLTDESSPFNECSHAYLAGAQALLLHIRHMPGHGAAADALVAKVEAEMLANGAALSLCRFSDEPFNTAAVLFPRWRDAPRHAPTALFLGGWLALLFAGAATGVRLWRSAAPSPGG
jgi:hypothetical protein